MNRIITTFPKRSEFEKAERALNDRNQPYDVVSPVPGYSRVGCHAIAITTDTRMAICEDEGKAFVCSGWVDYHPAAIAVPEENPKKYEDDIFGSAAIMLLAPCVADPLKVRIIAHIPNDISQVFPYINTVLKGACYNASAPNLTFMDGYRMISIYPHRIAVAKPDEIVDAWRTLEMIRSVVNGTWAQREDINPSYEMRVRPPALEIFKRLPRTNCRECGEFTCLSFASKVWQGQAAVDGCAPVFNGDYLHLKDALLEICQGLGTALEEKRI
jgi:ArsR family metal-binding transcriptional regulator